MKKTVIIPKDKLECLREHLNEAFKIFESLEVETGAKAPVKPKRLTNKQRIENYKKLIESGKKRTLPDHLKKRKAAKRQPR